MEKIKIGIAQAEKVWKEMDECANKHILRDAIDQINAEADELLNSGIKVPTKSSIDKIVKDRFDKVYGTNYDSNSCEQAQFGGMVITEWILNNA